MLPSRLDFVRGSIGSWDYDSTDVALPESARVIQSYIDIGIAEGRPMLSKITSPVAVSLLVSTVAWSPRCPGSEEIVPINSEIGEEFGHDVDANGQFVLVGADKFASDGPAAGRAFIFDRLGFAQLVTLLPVDPSDFSQFGYAVALDGSTAFVSAFRDDSNAPDAGSVYSFDSSTGVQLLKYTASDASTGDNLGRSIDAAEGLLVAGAYSVDAIGPNSGAVYVFDAASGAQLLKLVPADAASQDFYGWDVAIDGGRILAGAHLHDAAGEDAGAAYVFDAATGEQLHKFIPDDLIPGARFGLAVDLHGDFAAVTAPGVNSGSAAAYIFDLKTGTQLAKLAGPAFRSENLWGWSVSISATAVLVGAPQGDSAIGRTGCVDLFDLETERWIARVVPDGVEEGGEFGISTVLDGAQAFVGNYKADRIGADSGSVIVFDPSFVAPCPEDLDGSGQIDLADLNVLLGRFGSSADAGDTVDIDGSGIVDLPDLNAILARFGQLCTGEGTPER